MRDDLRRTLRSLLHRPAVYLVIVATLALGIGAATTVFSLVHAVILAPLPFPDADRLVQIWEVTPQGDRFSVSPPTYLDLQALGALSDVGAVSELTDGLVLSGEGAPVRVQAAAVTPSLLRLLRPPMALGRTLTAASASGGSAEVVLSHRLWTQRFAGRDDVLGRHVRLNGTTYAIVGVIAPHAGLPAASDVWIPLESAPASLTLPDRDDKWLSIVARLGPEHSVDGARDQLRALGRRLSDAYPRANADWSFDVQSLQASMVARPQRIVLWTLSGGVACLLLLACANVAGLLMIEVIRRDGEFRLRAALGATGWRLARLLLIESAVLAGLGAIAGVWLAYGAVARIRTHAAGVMPRIEQVEVDTVALLVSLALATASCLFIGSAPGLRAATLDLRAGLDSAGQGVRPGRARVRRGLTVLEIGLAAVLLSGAALLATSFARLSAVDVGFRVDRVLTVPLDFTGTAWPDTRQDDALRSVETRLAALPGVEAVGASTTNPWRQFGFRNNVTPEKMASTAPLGGLLQADWRAVTPGYFDALRVPILRGEGFSSATSPDSPRVVVVSQTLADRLWPGQDAVGKRVFWGGTTGVPRTVIGVSGDIRDVRLDEPAPPLLFVPHVQTPVPAMTVMIRTRSDAAALVPGVRDVLRELAPALPTPEMTALADSHADATSRPRLVAGALTAMAATGLVLATSGIYAVLAFAVVQRRREMSIRLAVGSTPVQVTRLVLVDGLRLAVLGIATGIAASLVFGELITGTLYGVAPTDPAILATVAAVLLAAACAASYLPARAASRIDPVQALRSE